MVVRRARSTSKPIALRSPDGRAALELHPGAGMVATSWTVDGVERLWLPEPAPSFLRRERTGGIPLLFPWANRLRRDRFELLGRLVDLRRGALVHRDEVGRPMHGLLLRWSRWDRVQVDARRDRASAELDWGAHRQLASLFPFSFTLRLEWRLVQGAAPGVEISAEVEAGDEPVPIAFGWHPYVRLPGARAACGVTALDGVLRRVPLEDGLPRRRHGALALDESPTARPLGDASSARRLGRARIDELCAGAREGTEVRIDGPKGARVAFQFVRGVRFAQLFAPQDTECASVEPMTAPTAALSDGAAELPILGPRQRFSACFRIQVVDPAPKRTARSRR
ncbi:MAG: aldose 1-epimerase [Phycisphaerae bacterium]|nr:aldose 1-epimerase [Phycisphaerae bacterium]